MTTTHPATAETSPDTCPTWCERQDPTDEGCNSPERRVILSLEDLELYTDGQWRDDYVTTFAFHHRPSRDSYVHLGRGEDGGMRLTPDEARRLALEWVAVADMFDSCPPPLQKGR